MIAMRSDLTYNIMEVMMMKLRMVKIKAIGHEMMSACMEKRVG